MIAKRKRRETFEVFDGNLARKVVPRRGRPYEHRCPLVSFEQIAHAAEELGEDGFTLETIAEHENLPWTQVAVALAFMKERGIVETRYRRNHAATAGVHLDAMTEYWVLAEGERPDFTCPTCGATHPPCTFCGGPTRCPPDEPGEPFTTCDTCDAEQAATG
jgi:hypothetical protein